jgi:putative multiple sugar transport system substrate-binding protein
LKPNESGASSKQGALSEAITEMPVETVSDPPQTPTLEAVSKKVGISLPGQSIHRWVLDGSQMQRQLEADGFIVDLRYADNDSSVQNSQLEEMIAADCDILVITPTIDSDEMGVLDQAKDKGIPVITYSNLTPPIYESDAVSYYISFDFGTIAPTLSKYIEEKLDLKNKSGPFNIELFDGSSDDSALHAHFSKDGLLDLLQPYIDNGQLVIPSGQIDLNQTATEHYSTEFARERMENLISSQNYGPNGTRLDAVICLNDWIAQGVTQALLDAGYTEDNFPIVTGESCDVASIKNIIQGTQSMSIFYSTSKLADKTVKIVESILRGEESDMDAPDDFIYIREKMLPAYYSDPDICTLENYRELLIDSGYYTEEEISE